MSYIEKIYASRLRALIIHRLLEISKVRTQSGFNRKLSKLNKMTIDELKALCLL